MGEKVRNAGVRAVMQCRATTWGEIKTFLDEWQPCPYNVIVKPMESAGSDDVTLCHSETEVQAAFGNIMGKVSNDRPTTPSPQTNSSPPTDLGELPGVRERGRAGAGIPAGHRVRGRHCVARRKAQGDCAVGVRQAAHERRRLRAARPAPHDCRRAARPGTHGVHVRARPERAVWCAPTSCLLFFCARSLARSGTPCWTRSASRTGLDTGR
jgi:hypothetical protein